MSSSRNSHFAAHIIPESRLAVQGWQQALAQAFTDLPSLLEYLQLDPSGFSDTEAAQTQFPLRVTREYAALMRKGDAHDPLLRQVLPSPRELDTPPGYTTDPVGDTQARKTPGLLQKYRGRALIMATGACAIHCRYCFRRYYPYAGSIAGQGLWPGILEHLSNDASLSEVILSGGDPLLVSDRRLQTWMEQLEGLPHLQRLRLHSRLPVVLPQRVTPELLDLLGKSRFQVVLVLHTNHPSEVSAELAEACTALREAGVTLLNQSVLLRGVNDHVDTLVELSEQLFGIGVLPYYLHLLDPVVGAAHFDLDPSQSKTIKQQLLARLPGYLVPKMVQEVPGADSKIPL
ncbi:MAG: EF-P beta-lysylation protein EpmB [Candidatus Thiodiazotropha sp.]